MPPSTQPAENKKASSQSSPTPGATAPPRVTRKHGSPPERTGAELTWGDAHAAALESWGETFPPLVAGTAVGATLHSDFALTQRLLQSFLAPGGRNQKPQILKQDPGTSRLLWLCLLKKNLHRWRQQTPANEALMNGGPLAVPSVMTRVLWRPACCAPPLQQSRS